jgi:DNA-binding MurR/RpiR family transcriptional regulator
LQNASSKKYPAKTVLFFRWLWYNDRVKHFQGAGPRGNRGIAVSKSILHIIESNMSAFSKGQKRIAAYILENYDKAAFMTASKLGKLVDVSESTVVRFASQLGYDGYPSMQRALQEMIRSRLTSTQRIQAAGDRLSGQDVLGTVLQSDIDKLREVVAQANRDNFDDVVERIMNARHIYILGARSSSFVAGYMNFYMHLLCENVTLVQSTAAGEIFEQMFRIGPGDVMIAISFPRYSQITMNTVKFARDRGATIIAVTDNELSPVYQMSDAALLAPCEMISFVDSMVAPLSLINALLVALAYRMGADVSSTFATLEDIWNEYGVFGKMDDE